MGSTLVLTNQAVDPDGSGDLTFALRPGAPSGVEVNQSGVLTWRPDASFVGTTNHCTLSVTDSGAPALTSEADVELIVVGAPIMHPLELKDGSVIVRWDSIPGAQYQIETTEDLASSEWATLGTTVVAGSFVTEVTLPKTDTIQNFFRVRVE